MRIVYKYEIDNWNGEKITLPVDARILHFAWQGTGTKGNAHVWIEINPDQNKLTEIRFAIFGTGHNIPDGWQYVGTLQNDGMVWHCYRK